MRYHICCFVIVTAIIASSTFVAAAQNTVLNTRPKDKLGKNMTL